MLPKRGPPRTTAPLSTAPTRETVNEILFDPDLVPRLVVIIETTVAALVRAGNMDAIDRTRRLPERDSHLVEVEAEAEVEEDEEQVVRPPVAERGHRFVADRTTTRRPYKLSQAW